jgi:uncharacterized protein YkwD
MARSLIAVATCVLLGNCFTGILAADNPPPQQVGAAANSVVAPPGGTTKEYHQPCKDENLAHTREVLLRDINDRRAKHGVPPLKVNATLETFAQHVAQTMLDDNRNFKEPVHYSMATFWSSMWNFSAADVIKSWYDDQKPLYNYANPGYSTDTAEFSQIVWKETTDIGIGFAGDSGWWCDNTVIAVFSPSAGAIGETELYRKNVLPAGARRFARFLRFGRTYGN